MLLKNGGILVDTAREKYFNSPIVLPRDVFLEPGWPVMPRKDIAHIVHRNVYAVLV